MTNYNISSFILLVVIGYLINNVPALRKEGIRNGKLAAQEKHKYQAGILGKVNGSIRLFLLCSAVVIDDYFLLSAANCLIEGDGSLKKRNFAAAVGTDNVMAEDAIKKDIYKIYTYLYNPETFENNLAILQLNEGLDLKNTEAIDSVRIGGPQNLINQKGIVTGYGFNEIFTYLDDNRKRKRSNGNTDFYLRSGLVDIVGVSRCESTYSNIQIPEQFCGIMRHNKRGETAGICQCDNGSPLVIKDTVVGLASRRNEACDDTTYGSIYTNVSHFKSFIDTVVAEDPYPGMRTYENPSHVLQIEL